MKDWRGVEITPGALVLYPAAGQRSGVEMVEATAVKINEATGTVTVDVIRRSSMWRYSKPRTTASTNVTVVTELPASSKETLADLLARN